MSEIEPGSAGQDSVDPTAEQPVQQPVRPRWRERSWSLPMVVVVALVAVLLGGLGGAALASVGDHQDGRRGPGFGRGPGAPQMPGRQVPGQRGFRFNDPHGSGSRQWSHQQQPRGPGGPLERFGDGATPTPTPAPPSSTS